MRGRSGAFDRIVLQGYLSDFILRRERRKKEDNLTISSGKQQLIIVMYSERVVPGSAWISCTFFKPPDVTNSLLALASCGKICARRNTTLQTVRKRRQLNYLLGNRIALVSCNEEVNVQWNNRLTTAAASCRAENTLSNIQNQKCDVGNIRDRRIVCCNAPKNKASETWPAPLSQSAF